MRVQIALHAELLRGAGGKPIWDALAARYARERFVRVLPLEEALPDPEDERRFNPEACNGTNRIDLHVVPNPAGHVLLVAIVDNLGKGAAGAAVQSLNLMLGLPEDAGLRAA
jgi:N-acetyl-gamma-glutamyl-phosphate reductase